MRMKIKPNLDLESIQKQLLDDIVQEYDHTGSINKVNILVRQSRLSGVGGANLPVHVSHQKSYAAKGSLHE